MRSYEISDKAVNMPTCAVCMEILGTYGGPVSLACGHNGCLTCLQELQTHLVTPLCPLCRTPFDSKLILRPNFDLKDALEKMQVKSSLSKPVIFDKEDDGQSNLSVMPSTYETLEDITLPEERDPWVSVSSSRKGNGDNSNFVQEEGSFEDSSDLGQRMFENSAPEVNFRNILTGLIAIVTGQSSKHSTSEEQQHHKPEPQLLQEEFTPSESNFYYPSFDIPSAPPLLQMQESDHLFYQTILEAEPPQWIPDSASSCCMQCRAPFKPVVRGRHHCRFCGGIFCRVCSNGKCLLPIKFRENQPQRVCDICYEKLEALQRFLIQHVSNAAQVAKHDVIDWTCMRSWLNMPLGLSMDQDIYKASNVLRSYTQIARLEPEKSIPLAVLQGAKGLAILTVAKAGLGVTYKFGTGLVVARKRNGSWSAPSAIASFGLGWGAQIGGELTDFVIVLRNFKAVKAFCSRVHFSLGGGLSVAAGPIGRAFEADYRAGDEGKAMCYTYSCSKGAFIGISLESNVVSSRLSTNMQFYGDPYLTPSDILLGCTESPRAAAALYSALHELFNSLE